MHLNEFTIHATKANSTATKSDKVCYEAFIDLASKHHLYYIHRFFVGNAQAITEFRFNMHSLQGAINIWTTAVNEDYFHTYQLK